ncbi:MAG: hypothetical protein GY759_05590 [Chloroflexi bacterium]|nr:hypothetical protein [Chloroflexota bacterium]
MLTDVSLANSSTPAINIAAAALATHGNPPPTGIIIGEAPAGSLPPTVLAATTETDIRINVAAIEAAFPGGSDNPGFLAMLLLHEYYHCGDPYPGYGGDACSEIKSRSETFDEWCQIIAYFGADYEMCLLYQSTKDAFDTQLLPYYNASCVVPPNPGLSAPNSCAPCF